MAKQLAATADRIVRRWAECNQANDWDIIRDACDLKTGGELDCVQLDILTDLVMARLNTA